MSNRFKEKVVLVTASTAGIGLGIVLRLGAEGAKLVVCSRKEDKVQETVELLTQKGYEAVGQACNVSKLSDIKAIVKLAVDTYGRIDVLVSNAAVNPASGGILEIPDWAIDKLLGVNIKSPIQLIREVKPHMSQGGSIVMVASIAAYLPAPPIALYGVTKTAVVSLARSLANELGCEGIRVNAIAPGIVPTKFANALVENSELRALQEQSTWLGRLGTVEDMAGAVAYLASEDASYVTGECLVVSGGTYARL